MMNHRSAAPAASPCPVCGAAGLDREPVDVEAVIAGDVVPLLRATCVACGWHYTPEPTRRLHAAICAAWTQAPEHEIDAGIVAAVSAWRDREAAAGAELVGSPA